MHCFRVQGGIPLSGSVTISGSKNAALPIICATLLSKERFVLKNVPNIVDIHAILRVLNYIGSEYSFENNTLTIQTKKIRRKKIMHNLVSKLRASILLLGPILARSNQVALSYPGGCVIGKRPVDTHLDAFKRLGAKVREKNDIITLSAPKGLSGADITMQEQSVTATENIIMSAILAKGKTIIRLAACEPHVVDMCKFLVKMGAKIKGIGNHQLSIEGGRRLKGVKYTITPDYLEAGTLAISAAITKGEVTLKKAPIHQLDALWQKFEEAKIPFRIDKDSITILPIKKKMQPIRKLRTGVYPSFPTDLQAPFAVLLTQAHGISKIFETLFEGRLSYLFELEKMGAQMEIINNNQALIIGPTKLRGSPIDSCDIRAGAAMVIAALGAKGESEISNINYIDRGYEGLDLKLRKLGAQIERFQI